MMGILLARRDSVSFVASPPERTDSRRTSHENAARSVVTIPVSEAEYQGAGLRQGRTSAWPPAAPRPDLLAAMIAPLIATQGMELWVRTSHEGTTFCAQAPDGTKNMLTVGAADVVGLLASLFQYAPRGVMAHTANPAERLMIAVAPDKGPGTFRARIASAAAAPPADLTTAGVSTSLADCVVRTLTDGPAFLLVSGTAGSGRSTTLSLLCSALTSRGMKGIGIPAADGLERLPCSWPFLDSLPAGAWDFVVMDEPESMDWAMAARLVSRGRRVLMSCGPGEAGALASHVERSLMNAGAPHVAVSVLAQDLVRQICADCAHWINLPTERATGLGFHATDLADFAKQGGLTVPQGRRCARCRATGTMGLMGVFEFSGPYDLEAALPRMREDGWSKVFQGHAHFEDVMALPGAQTPMRPMRTIGSASTARVAPPPVPHAPQPPRSMAAPAAASQSTAPQTPAAPAPRQAAPAESVKADEFEDPLHEPFGTVEEPVDEEAVAQEPEIGALEDEVIDMPPGSALTDAEAWASLVNDSRSRDADPGALDDLVTTIQRRASGQEALAELLAPSRGFHLGRHCVNTALLSVRIGREMEAPPDPAALARLGLLHDVGIAGVGIDFATDLPATVSKESLDQSGSRMSPGIILNTLGVDDPLLEESIRCVHRTLSIKDHVPEKDPVVQIVGIASLVEMNSHGPGPGRPRDVHDATAVVLERHARAFGREVFRALLMAVPIYPVGCLVELSSGDFGRVVSLNPVNYFRPRVEIRVTGGGGGLPERRVIDLARAPFLHIRHRVASADAGAAAGR